MMAYLSLHHALLAAWFTTIHVAAQSLTMTASTVQFQAAAGPDLQTAPAGTPILSSPLYRSASTQIGGFGTSWVQSSLDLGPQLLSFDTSLYASSVLPGSSSAFVGPLVEATAEVMLTLTATAPVFADVTIDWRFLTYIFPMAGVTVQVDVFDDGRFELNGFIFPVVVTLPLAFGPGSIPIRVRTLLSCRANVKSRQISGTGQLHIRLTPNPGNLILSSTPSVCSTPIPLTLAADLDFDRRIRFQIAAPASPSTLGALILGSTLSMVPLAFPPLCHGLTDPLVVRWLLPTEVAGTPVYCSTHNLTAPFALHTQALLLDLQSGQLLASNRMTIGAR